MLRFIVTNQKYSSNTFARLSINAVLSNTAFLGENKKNPFK